MESSRLKKNIVFVVTMLILTILIVVGMVYDFIPSRYDLAAYLLIISMLLFLVYGLLGIAEKIQNNKREDIVNLVNEEKGKETDALESIAKQEQPNEP